MTSNASPFTETGSGGRLAFDRIPIIDLSSLRDESPESKSRLAGEIRDACQNVGFFYVSNHGIPEIKNDNVLAEMESFFSLPIETKMKIENKKSPNFMGYSPLMSGKNDPNGAGDLHEGFEFGWEEMAGGSEGYLDTAMSGKNVWPEGSPSFRKASLEYYHAAVNLGRVLFPLFALALGLSVDFFSTKTQNSAALMRLLHYPPQGGEFDDRVMGIGAHTDWECFTILWQQPGIQALQVLNAEKKWIDAPPIPGTLVVNLGDQFARWTNDVFKSTVHRAVNRSGVRRYSIPLFFGTDYDVKLEPFPGCVTPTRPAKYEVVTAGDYVKSRLAATYGH